MKARRIALCIAIPTLMVVVAIALLPRSYLVNDDAGLGEYLRKGVFTPWMSPLLVRGLSSIYALEPDVPWYALYLYFLIIVTGAVLMHTCSELIDPRPGWGHTATLLGAIVLGAHHIILAVGITWTTVAISAGGIGMAAFVAHIQRCDMTDTPVSRGRALLYGMLVLACYTLRMEALQAVIAIMAPVVGWLGVSLLRKRRLPRISALALFVAPLIVVLAVQNRIPAMRGAEHDEFNDLRGRIHGHSAFGTLDTRAPEVLARAGWTVDEYRDFTNWLFVDDTVFTNEKLHRLLDTGGVPAPTDVTTGLKTVRGIFEDSAASVWLFLGCVAAVIALAWLGVVERRRSIVLAVGYLVFSLAVPLWMSAQRRFPQRVSLSFYAVAALALFIYLAYEIAKRPAIPDEIPPATPAEAARSRRATRALLALSFMLFLWARNVFAFMERDIWPYHDQLQQFAARVEARHGFIYVQAGMVELDPLQVDPHGYDGLPGGWGVFTALWYDYIRKFGFENGHRILRYMVDNPNAYLLASPYGRPIYEDWMRRQMRDPTIRLALVDAADGMPESIRSELYRVVTTPLSRDSEEWHLSEHLEWTVNDELPGPADVGDIAFRTVAFDAPLDQHLSLLPGGGEVAVEPIEGGIRARLRGTARERCAPGEAQLADVDAGIRVSVRGMAAARFAIKLVDPEDIVAVHAYAETAGHRSVRWDWTLAPEANRYGFEGTFTLVPGFPARRLALSNSTASPDEIRAVHVFISARPGSHAGFELRRFEVAEP